MTRRGCSRTSRNRSSSRVGRQISTRFQAPASTACTSGRIRSPAARQRSLGPRRTAAAARTSPRCSAIRMARPALGRWWRDSLPATTTWPSSRGAQFAAVSRPPERSGSRSARRRDLLRRGSCGMNAGPSRLPSSASSNAGSKDRRLSDRVIAKGKDQARLVPARAWGFESPFHNAQTSVAPGLHRDLRDLPHSADRPRKTPRNTSYFDRLARLLIGGFSVRLRAGSTPLQFARWVSPYSSRVWRHTFFRTLGLI